MNDLIKLKLVTEDEAECLHRLQVEAKRKATVPVTSLSVLFYKIPAFLSILCRLYAADRLG